MNYATIEEAWGRKPSPVASKNLLASVRNPLAAKPVPQELFMTDHVEIEDEPDDAKLLMDTRKILKRIYDELGDRALEALLPRDYVASQQQQPFPDIDIEEVARWLLMGAIMYVILDLVRK